MEFDLSKIESSKSDMNRGVRLPTCLNEELSEFMGIVAGDGHLHFSIGKQKGGTPLIRSDLIIACNKNEQGYIRFIMNLFYLLFNTKLSYEPDKRSQTILLRAHSKSIVQFLNKVCEIPLNRKSDIVFIPDIVRNADCNIKYAFLRGLADTDFSITFRYRQGKGHVYPSIRGNFKSKTLVNHLELLFKELGFSYCVCYDVTKNDKRFGPTTINQIYLNGKDNFKRWIKCIGFSNSKFQRKAEKWQKEGVCPPEYKEPPRGIAPPTSIR